MHAMTTQQRADIFEQMAFFGAKYSLILGVVATLAYSLSSLA